MRRIYTPVVAALAALTLLAADARAQTIGFKLGAAFSNMSTDVDALSTEGMTGFTGGGHIRFGLGGRVGIQAEILSTTRGANFTGSRAGAADNFDLRFEYVDIPLMLFVPLTTGMVAPYVFGGPALSLEVRCRFTPTGTSGAAGERDCDEAGLQTRSPDFSLVGGGGLAFGMGPGTVLIEGRYTAGMRSIDDSGVDDFRHRSVSVLAGYEIPLGRRW